MNTKFPMNASNSISREDFASPEQIERNVDRLRKIGDLGRTGNLLAGWEAEERARIVAERNARGDDLPLFAA